MKYQEIIGDLISFALEGKFDLVIQGFNCQNVQKSGIAPQFVKAFGTDKFPKEHPAFVGNINKLGTIDYRKFGKDRLTGEIYRLDNILDMDMSFKPFYVVNCYTQFIYGTNHTDGISKPLDYEALTLCLRKINHTFKGKHIGLPMIGCGLAGGVWDFLKLDKTSDERFLFEAGYKKDVKTIIKEELKDMDVTIVFLEQNKHLMLNEKD